MRLSAHLACTRGEILDRQAKRGHCIVHLPVIAALILRLVHINVTVPRAAGYRSLHSRCPTRMADRL
jgi:hypothetical protein